MNGDSHLTYARRRFLKMAGYTGAGLLSGLASPLALAAGKDETLELPFGNGVRKLEAFPGKRPLIVLTNRPPQLETPFSVFNEGLITPNDAFFVRYHWSGIPTSVDAATFRLKIHGSVEKNLELSLDDLKKLPVKEVTAVHQCSGNSRGFFEPRINGGQLGHGAMGNAKWKGVALKDVLAQAGVAAGARQVAFNGLDHPPVPNGPDFIKALDIDHATDGEVMLAWSMNDEDLPLLNGYPLRLVVPGYYGTYWVKHLNDIEVMNDVFDGFWMSKAYRIPDNDCHCAKPGEKPGKTIPIARFSVRSFLTSLTGQETVPVGKETLLRGIAFDGGTGIASVAVSQDGGKSWQDARLGEDLGKYSFREWTLPFTAKQKGEHVLMVKATSKGGETQPAQANWNPAGYRMNRIEQTRVMAA